MLQSFENTTHPYDLITLDECKQDVYKTAVSLIKAIEENLIYLEILKKLDYSFTDNEREKLNEIRNFK